MKERTTRIPTYDVIERTEASNVDEEFNSLECSFGDKFFMSFKINEETREPEVLIHATHVINMPLKVLEQLIQKGRSFAEEDLAFQLPRMEGGDRPSTERGTIPTARG